MLNVAWKYRRMAIAGGVLAVGIVVALLFRKPQETAPDQTSAIASNTFAVAPHAPAETSDETLTEATPQIPAPAKPRDPPATATADFQWIDPVPPPLDLQYPGVGEKLFNSQPFTASAGQPDEQPAIPRRTHRVKDGDTLRSVAVRYLRDPERAREIFDENRDLLSDPELLPVGALLRIPD